MPAATQGDGRPARSGDVLSALGQKLQGGVEVPLGHSSERITSAFSGMGHFGAGCRFLGGMRRGVHVRIAIPDVKSAIIGVSLPQSGLSRNLAGTCLVRNVPILNSLEM